MIKIILAGILGIPSLLLAVLVAPIIGILAIPSLLLLLFQKEDDATTTTATSSSSSSIPDHVIVVGGSSGIGLAIARIAASQRKVPKVTILARDPVKLEKARKLIEQDVKDAASPTKVRAVSVCVTDYERLQKVAGQIVAGTDKKGDDKSATTTATTTERIVLFSCAGISYTTEFESVPIEVYSRLVETNQLGAMYVVRSFLPHLQKGCIVLCASGAGQLGMYGYSVYSPTKYALRGLAETLHMELIRSRPGVSVQIAFPLDTETPGYEMEREMMPEITKILNSSGGVAKAEETARIMVDSAFAKNPKFQVYFSLDGWMLSNLTAGMTPVSNLFDAVTQVTLGGLLRYISLFYLNDFWRIIRSYQPTTATKETATTTATTTTTSIKTDKKDVASTGSTDDDTKSD